jgi:predicted MPP superfamily phosphohydrolase
MIFLRFSDYETDTIVAHRDLIGERGCVWWGWWQKLHEPWPQDVFDNFRSQVSRSEIRIGLLNRASKRYYVGICEEFAEQEGTRFPSPNANETPEYYRSAQMCPAWFKLTGITDLSDKQWEEEFGPVPVDDRTLFVVSENMIAARVAQVDLPAPELPSQVAIPRNSVQVITAAPNSGVGVLHISDLHFGEDYGFNATSKFGVARSLVQVITSNFVGTKPAALVVSGDLSTRGDPNGLTGARLFLEELAKALGIPREAVIIAPGNHDILLDSVTPTRDFSNEQQFRDLVHLFYGGTVDLERVHHITDNLGMVYVIGVVNSSRPRTQSTKDYGYVGRDRSEPVFERIEGIRSNLTDSTSWGAFVLHHHVLPAPLFESPEDGRPVSLTLDSGEIVSFAQKYGINAILHGHQHLPFIGSVSRISECPTSQQSNPSPHKRVSIMGMGSTSARVDRLRNELRNNTFGYYVPHPDGSLAGHVYQYNLDQPTKELWSFDIPSGEG